MMMGRSKPIWPYVTIVGLMLSMDFGTAQTEALGCQTNTNCRASHFCYLETNTCIRCLKCSDMNRHSNPNIPCNEESRHCGLCVEGYVDRQGECTPSAQNVPNTVDENAATFSFAYISIVAIGAMIAGTIIIAALVWWNRKNNRGLYTRSWDILG